MRIAILTVWLLLPVAGVAYHYGPGQQQLVLDDVSTILAQADHLVAQEDWTAAIEKYDEALSQLPKERPADIWRVRLEKSKAQMFASQLPLAHQDLKQLVDEIANSKEHPELLDEARGTLANSQYYMTWLMRLEGVSREEWEPEVESARELYRLLAERAEEAGDQTAAKKNQEDLESTIRLARMDLKDLQGLPIPSQ